MAKTVTSAVAKKARRQVRWLAVPQGSRELYASVRAALMLQGLTLTAWCEANKVQRPWAYQCLIGTANGPKAAELRSRIVESAGLKQP